MMKKNTILHGTGCYFLLHMDNTSFITDTLYQCVALVFHSQLFSAMFLVCNIYIYITCWELGVATINSAPASYVVGEASIVPSHAEPTWETFAPSPQVPECYRFVQKQIM
ncbi:hypothetical protein XELAEV_18034248mg [Xenopus laevis]|uniref:Uncharacterized protein n=1 Tax=Xenopus laevis TaxID=8355 RepID=A0A974HB45_XENLA|nr:hypothetical protein XELAEV_18034248mg [Xenopus laevis]